MSQEVRYSVALAHLSADAARAGAELPPVNLADVSVEQLRRMVEAVAALAPRVEYPVKPEVRIRSTDGLFLLQVKEGRLHFSSWSIRIAGDCLTPDQILETITGEAPAPAEPGVAVRAAQVMGQSGRAWRIGALAVGIIACNAATAWMLTRPPPDPLPAHRLLEPEPAERFLAKVAGVYATGSAVGDRRLRIETNGALHWVKLGPNGTVSEEETLTANAARTGDRNVLVTSARELIEVRDAITVMFFGDTYRRVQP